MGSTYGAVGGSGIEVGNQILRDKISKKWDLRTEESEKRYPASGQAQRLDITGCRYFIFTVISKIFERSTYETPI